MISNIAKHGLLLRGTGVLLKRYNIPQIAYSVKSKWDATSSKDQSTTLEAGDDDDDDQPIKYSTSKAAAMRIDEYRDPTGDKYPWYQGYIISASLAVFLGYFCILREENDIDMLLYTDLEETLQRTKRELQKENAIKSK